MTSGEAGGITQHIGAYQVNSAGNAFTFIDTPGHAAFSDMRSRGANITDIVILVVAADDSVKEQTADSIKCARDAGVPIVVAINKCDLETAEPAKVKTELTQYEILAEDLGGDVLVEEISAKTGDGIPKLLEKVRMQADLMEVRRSEGGNDGRLERSDRKSNMPPTHTTNNPSRLASLISAKGQPRQGRCWSCRRG